MRQGSSEAVMIKKKERVNHIGKRKIFQGNADGYVQNDAAYPRV